MERNWSGDMNYKELMAADIPIASAIISYGEDWKIERVNTEFVKLSGYTERDLGGKWKGPADYRKRQLFV